MSPYHHARIHAKKWNGHPDDFIKVDEFIDSSKYCFPDVRHRALLHSTFGIMMAEQVFGPTITMSTGKQVPTREIVLDHILQDLGFVPTVGHYLENMVICDWMSGTEKRRKAIERKYIKLED